MKPRKLIKEAQRIASPYCITNGEKFRLKDFDPGDTDGVKSKKVAQSMLQGSGLMLTEMQEKLYAQDQWALLLIFQGMDAAGQAGPTQHRNVCTHHHRRLRHVFDAATPAVI